MVRRQHDQIRYTLPTLPRQLDTGGHVLLSMGFADIAEGQHQSNMSIQDWCIQ
jgi:hypothetical protein